MRRSPCRAAAVVVLAVASLLTAAAPARADEPASPGPVIVPGQEALLGQMLGNGTKSLAGGCVYQGASVEKNVVKGRYVCAGAGATPATVALAHRSAGSDGDRRTAQFAILSRDAPAPLLDALAARVRAGEAKFRWVVPATGTADGGTAAGPGRDAGAPPTKTGRTEEEDREYQRGLGLYRDGKFAEAYAVFHAMAQKNPQHGVLGMVVAALASTHPTKERAEELAGEAESRAGEVLAQFVAGVGAHYYAHQSGRDGDEKKAFYRTALKFLEKARGAYDFEPRLWIYLAVSNFRLGNQSDAESLIEKAVSLGNDDPDAYYCRAEIFQRSNVQRSIQDIDTYIRLMEENEKRSGIVSKIKNERVRRMRDRLIQVSRGEADPKELFDPVGGEAHLGVADGGAPGSAGTMPPGSSPGGGAPFESQEDEQGEGGSGAWIELALVGAAILTVGVGVVLSRRRRPGGGTPTK